MEKRRFKRIWTEIQAKASIADLPPVEGLTRDLSAGGLFMHLFSKDPVEAGSPVLCEFRVPTEFRAGGEQVLIEAPGTIVRVEKSDSILGIAVKFRGPDLRLMRRGRLGT